MPDQNIALVYFSGTHVTKTYAKVIGGALTESDCFVELFDITPYTSRQKPLPVERLQVFIFGFSVYADFAPSVVNTWLPKLKVSGKPCAQFLTYGARISGYAHFHTMQILEQAGFQGRLSADCSMCRDCETECPTLAFNADTGLSNPADCIECMHCPDQVIEIDKRMKETYWDFKAFWQLTEPMMHAKKCKIISESWQAAS